MICTTGGTLQGVDEGVGVCVEVGVEVDVGNGVAVKVGTEIVAGKPTTRATRNCSTMPSRLDVRWMFGNAEPRMGTMSGCSKSTVTETRSPGPPALFTEAPGEGSCSHHAG